MTRLHSGCDSQQKQEFFSLLRSTQTEFGTLTLQWVPVSSFTEDKDSFI